MSAYDYANGRQRSLSQEIEKYVKDTSLAVSELWSEAAAWRKNEASQRSNGGTLHSGKVVDFCFTKELIY